MGKPEKTGAGENALFKFREAAPGVSPLPFPSFLIHLPLVPPSLPTGAATAKARARAHVSKAGCTAERRAQATAAGRRNVDEGESYPERRRGSGVGQLGNKRNRGCVGRGIASGMRGVGGNARATMARPNAAADAG